MSVTGHSGFAGVSIQTRGPAWPQRRPHSVKRGRIDKVGFDPPAFGEIPEPVAQSPIHDPGCHDMRAARQALEHRRGGCHPG
jgi:hypothetical protein